MMQYHQFRYDGPSHIEHRQTWMDAVTENKFFVWDDVVRRNILEEGTSIEKAQALKLLFDPTIYTYAFFRDGKGDPIKLYSYQDMIVNDPNERIAFVASNQIGKSFALCVKAVHFMIHHPGKTIIMVSKTLPQSKDLLRQIRRFLDSSIIEYKTDVGDSDTKTEIYMQHFDVLPNGAQVKRNESRIICVPATEAALGYPADLMLLDELDFYEDAEYLYDQVFDPRTYKTHGQLIAFSNPNGDIGMMFRFWNEARFSKYRFNFLDCPGNTQERLEMNMEGKSQSTIDSTLLAVFTSGKGVFLSIEERKAIQENRPNQLPLSPDGTLYVCFDFAKVEDQTVRAVARPIPGGGIYIYELKAYPNGTPYSAVVEDLQQLIAAYGVEKFQAIGWDNTGVGAGIEDFINKIQFLGIPCIPVKFSMENKARMYTIFKTYAERSKGVDEFGNPRRLLNIPYIKECDRQLATLRFKGVGQQMKVHHEKESDRDDYPDAIACCCGLIVHKDYVPSDAELIMPKKRTSLYDRLCESCKNPLDDEQKDCPLCGVKAEEDWSGII